MFSLFSGPPFPLPIYIPLRCLLLTVFFGLHFSSVDFSKHCLFLMWPVTTGYTRIGKEACTALYVLALSFPLPSFSWLFLGYFAVLSMLGQCCFFRTRTHTLKRFPSPFSEVWMMPLQHLLGLSVTAPFFFFFCSCLFWPYHVFWL